MAKVATVHRRTRSYGLTLNLGEIPVGESFDWMDDAACGGMPTEVFFPGPEDISQAAQRVCALCPVRQPCLAWGLEMSNRQGVWGGQSANQRRPLLRIIHA